MNLTNRFDRDFALSDLIAPKEAGELAVTLTSLIDSPVSILDSDGQHFAGEVPVPGVPSAPLTLELEPIGYLSSNNSFKKIEAATEVFRWGMVSRARARMVSDLHMEAVRADYVKLQKQNLALNAAQAKYRELSELLDAKVKDQVEIINKQQRQLYYTERLASIGQLAAGIAHEINNPLGFVSSNLSFIENYVAIIDDLRKQVPEKYWESLNLDFASEDFADLLVDSRQGIDRIARIIKDLKGFSSIHQLDEQFVDMNEQVELLLSVIEGQKSADVTIQTDLNPLPPIRCFPGHINQALMNILKNALQAVDGYGTVRLSTSASPEGVSISISDSGQGIPEELLPHIFDPFFTTREVGEGTGLGLTVARDIISAHGGSLSVSNQKGAGVIATVELPVKEQDE